MDPIHLQQAMNVCMPIEMFHGFLSVVVITSPLHGEGRWFNPSRNINGFMHTFMVFAALHFKGNSAGWPNSLCFLNTVLV